MNHDRLYATKQHKVDDSHYDMPLIYYIEGLTVSNLDIIGIIEDEEMFSKLCDKDAESRITFDIRPTRDKYESQCWIHSHPFFQQYFLLTLVIKHQRLFETYLSKLEKSRKCGTSSRFTYSVPLSEGSSERKWLNDRVITELNVRVFKLETIIQVMLTMNTFLHVKETTVYKYETAFSLHDYLLEEEFILALQDEERLRLEQEKIIADEKTFKIVEAKRLMLEEEKMLQGCIAKKVKPWIEDLSRLFGSVDTVWLSDEIQRFIHPPGNLKHNFPWSDDYTIDRNFWLSLVCLDPGRKGWLNEEHIDLWVDYMWHVKLDTANGAMVSSYFVQLLLQNGMPLFYADGKRYDSPWSDVDQVRM
ncbi:hypothetical protein Tco_1283214 [Tanacetum coccineum]